jgi:hypothetical protein
MRMHTHASRPPVLRASRTATSATEHSLGPNRPPDERVVPDSLLAYQQLAGNAAVASLVAGGTVQRDDTSPKPSVKPQGGAKTIDLIFIITKPKDRYTKDMIDYVKNTLKGQEYRVVTNIEDICAEASKLSAQGITLSKVRIVSHGQTVIGGVGMTPAKEKTWRYVKPDEVRAYMKSPGCQGLRGAMAPNAEVEFWGCYLGGLPQAGEAWADLFGKKVRSTKGEMKVGAEDFIVRGKGAATSSKDVPKNVEKHFKEWLLKQYKLMASTGEAPALKTEADQITFMKDLFDRSGGKIRSRVIQEKGATRKVRPGESDEVQMWETVDPTQ